MSVARQLTDTAIVTAERATVAGVATSASIDAIVNDIGAMNWASLTRDELLDSAWVYYYFSVQFRENVEIARLLFPADPLIEELDHGERDTDNLSPCPGVVGVGEKVDHDEFMLRALRLETIDPARQARLEAIGERYLSQVRALDKMTRASSLSSYEAGGLEHVFTSILRATTWDGPALHAFRHFLVGHIALDTDPEHGHGSLCEHLKPTFAVRDLWEAFRESLIAGVPGLLRA